MTVPEQPSDPAVPVPPTPEPSPEESAAQQAAAQQAAAEAALTEQIRALAAEIAKQAILEYDPVTRRKGTVSSLQTTATPPTITVTISGATTVEIPGVCYYEHYVPEVGDVVHIDKQGTDIVAMGKIAEQYSEGSFTDVALSGGFTHNGNGNGNMRIRRVWDHGQWKVQVQGSVARSSGTVISAALDPKYRPVNATRRTVIAARDATTQNSVKIDFDNTGVISMVGGNTSTSSVDPGDTGSATPNDSTHSHGNHEHGIPESTHQHPAHDHSISGSTAGLSEHNHGGAVSTVGHQHGTHTHNSGATDAGESTHSHSGTTTVTQPNDSTHNHGGHAHTMGTHAHGGTDPAWISFNMVEYFL